MNVLGAILKDSFHEARDRRAVAVVGLMAAAAIAFCCGLSFRERDESELLARSVQRLGQFERSYDGGEMRKSVQFAFEPLDTRRVEASDGFGEELAGGWRIAFRLPRAGELEDLRAQWAEFFEKPLDKQPEPLRWAEQRLRADGWQKVELRADPQDPTRFELAAVCSRKERLRGAYSSSLFFGLVETDGGLDRSREEFVLTVQIGLAAGLLGGLGIFVALLTCAGFVPTMLTKGTLDLALARPVGRGRLLLYKYLGGLWFIAITSVIVVGGTWAALALKIGVYDARYLLMAPISIAIFAVLYAPVVLAAVLTRSANVAGLAGVGVWWTSSIVVNAYDFTKGFEGLGPVLRSALSALHAVLPKTSHLSELGQRYLVEARLGGPEGLGRVLDELRDFDWSFSLGTTAAFTAGCLALAVWLFRRADY